MYYTRTNFRVQGILANPHIQSLLASSKLRKRLKLAQYEPLLQNQTDVLLNAGNNDRLHAYYSKALFRSHFHSKSSQSINDNGPDNTALSNHADSKPNPSKLVILIHGWEGSGESTYLLSAASSLYRAGFSVLRLHLRDHGPSAHLNKELFHAARLEEVLLGIQDIQNRYDYDEYYLVGFSLGGNFALRVANHAAEYQLNLNHVVAVSPVFSPAETMEALNTGPKVYRQYFIKKWRKALRNKQTFFPELYDFNALIQSNNLQEMTEHLVKEHTHFDRVDDYFDSYALNPSDLEQTRIKTDVIVAADDPVIPIKGTNDFSSAEHFRLRIFKHGGHCGFIQNWRLESWVDQELLSLFS